MRQILERSPMELKGSCHCGSVKFTVQSPHPYPFNLCYCSICRKTAGGGGHAINLSGRYKTLKVTGKKNITVYRARMRDEATGKITKSTGRRNFCKKCGSTLWLWDPQWPELVHPAAPTRNSTSPRKNPSPKGIGAGGLKAAAQRQPPPARLRNRYNPAIGLG